MLEGLLGCSRQAQHDLKLYLPLQTWSSSGTDWDRGGGCWWGVENCTASGALCFQKHVLGFRSSFLENVPSPLSLQKASILLFFDVQLCLTLSTPWTHQASLSFTIYQSLPKLMSIDLMMPSNHLVLCHALLLLTSIFPSIRVFFNK